MAHLRKQIRDNVVTGLTGLSMASGHLTDIKKAWRQVCGQAELKEFRMHDLRHTFASRVVSGTGSLYVAGQLLGHTQPQTTARYAHLLDDAMRDALDQVSDKLTAGRQ